MGVAGHDSGGISGVRVAGFAIDYQEVFRVLPGALAVLTPDGVILAVNDGYLEAAGRELGDVLGRNVCEGFPGNPTGRGDWGQQMVRDSLETVGSAGEPGVMGTIRDGV